MFKRVMGKASFAKIADRSGQIQLFLQERPSARHTRSSRATTSATSSGAEGVLFRTRTGELSVRVEQPACC